jgi:hypothetical protein
MRSRVRTTHGNVPGRPFADAKSLPKRPSVFANLGTRLTNAERARARSARFFQVRGEKGAALGGAAAMKRIVELRGELGAADRDEVLGEMDKLRDLLGEVMRALKGKR